ncbi:transglutaminase-like cysteine peptidase [Sphingobium sp.]|uniref:transglutaminase-like cysteine peptidase n=1 Tax=Sphingobium sp. TaxID=1912891 RepID=UPI003B3A9DEC
MRLSRKLFVVTSFIIAMSGSPAFAQAIQAPFLSLGHNMDAPRGMREMCESEPSAFCGDMSGRAEPSQIIRTNAWSDYATSALAHGDAFPAARPATLCDIAAAFYAAPSAPVMAGRDDRIEITGHDLEMPPAISFYDPFASQVSTMLNKAAEQAAQSGCGDARPLLRAVPALASMMVQQEADAPSAMTATLQPAVHVRIMAAPMTAVDQKTAMKLIKTINGFVNRRVAQRTDWENYSRGELWRRSGVGKGAQGDCEDIAIEKRHQLIAQKFPADRLAFAVVYQPQVGLHTILVARLPDGDYVLDSLSPYVDRWDKTHYSWLSLQDFQIPGQWHAPGAATGYQVASQDMVPNA